MKFSRVMFFGFLLIACNNGSKSFSQTGQQPTEIIDEFFQIYESEGYDTALNYIFSTNRWIDNNESDINQLKETLNTLISAIGEYRGKNLIVKKSIGEDYILWSYMIKYDRQPLRFMFIFYRALNEWQLQNFRYDDELEIELIEAANAYRLDENLPGENER